MRLDELVLAVTIGSGLGGGICSAAEGPYDLGGGEKMPDKEALMEMIRPTAKKAVNGAIADMMRERREKIINGDYSLLPSFTQDDKKEEDDYFFTRLKYMDGSLVAEAKAKNPGLNEAEFRKSVEDKLRGIEKQYPHVNDCYIFFKMEYPEWAQKHDPITLEEKKFYAFMCLHLSKLVWDDENVRDVVNRIPVDVEYGAKKRIFYNKYKRENPETVKRLDKMFESIGE